MPCVVLVFTEKNRLNYVLSSAEGSGYDCKYLCELLNGLYSGKAAEVPALPRAAEIFAPILRNGEKSF